MSAVSDIRFVDTLFAASAEPQAIALAWALAALALLASARLLWRRPPRWPARVLLQGLAMLLLWRLLCPPALPLLEAGRIDVLGAGWRQALSSQGAGELNPAAAVRALPEAERPLPAGVRAVPDLGTALRESGSAQLRLIGEGLAARDRDAARGRLAEWLPAPLPPGLVELQAPAQVDLGAEWTLRGRWRGPPPTRLELRAADSVLASFEFAIADAIDASTQAQDFSLSLPARAAGLLDLELVAVEADTQPTALLSLPVTVSAPEPLRIGLLATAPSAELRALRRWAVDAGHALDSRILLAPGRVLGGARPGFDAATLQALDLLIVDERAWGSLGSQARAEVQTEVERGLGLLLRLGAVPNAAQRALLAEQGFALASHQGPRERQLPGIDGSLLALPVDVVAEQAAVLLRDAEDEPLGRWRPRGLGRVGLLWLTDSQALPGRGEASAHARLWASIASQLARPRAPQPQPEQAHSAVPALGWQSQRLWLCGLQPGESALRIAPSGHQQALAPADAQGCSAVWPRESGRHLLQSTQARTPLQVLQPDALPALAAGQRAQATNDMLRQALSPTDSALRTVPGPAWPWLPPLLLVLAALWWLERPQRQV
jgi:hypothetical protein